MRAPCRGRTVRSFQDLPAACPRNRKQRTSRAEWTDAASAPALAGIIATTYTLALPRCDSSGASECPESAQPHRFPT